MRNYINFTERNTRRRRRRSSGLRVIFMLPLRDWDWDGDWRTELLKETPAGDDGWWLRLEEHWMNDVKCVDCGWKGFIGRWKAAGGFIIINKISAPVEPQSWSKGSSGVILRMGPEILSVCSFEVSLIIEWLIKRWESHRSTPRCLYFKRSVTRN